MKTINNYSIGLETFLFKRSWAEVFRDLTDEEAGRLIKSIFEFTEGTEAPPADPKTRAVYRLICRQLNNSAFAYLRKAGLLTYATNEEQTE